MRPGPSAGQSTVVSASVRSGASQWGRDPAVANPPAAPGLPPPPLSPFRIQVPRRESRGRRQARGPVDGFGLRGGQRGARRQRAVQQVPPENYLVMVAPAVCDLPARRRPAWWRGKDRGAARPAASSPAATQCAMDDRRCTPWPGSSAAIRLPAGPATAVRNDRPRSRWASAKSGARPPFAGIAAIALRIARLPPATVAVHVPPGGQPGIGQRGEEMRIGRRQCGVQRRQRPPFGIRVDPGPERECRGTWR